MSKHMNKNRSKRSALKLETLEQRQLLATIVAGSGTEVNSDVLLSNGNTYDQILLTGSTITVKADAGQVTRVDFLDADGDIIRAELSGAGELTVSLADFKAAATPAEYATDVKYVQGNASFRITGSDASTNFTLYSLGTANVNGGLANPIFADGTKDGGNNVANASRLVIEASNSALGSEFGGIRAGNAVFSDASGAVGIIAPDVQFQGPIIIGDIEATGNAIPVLQIGQFSANKTVTVAGGDLKLGNANEIQNSNIAKIVATSGSTSMSKLLSTQTIDGTKFQTDITADKIEYKSSAATVTIDGKTVTQDELDAYKDLFLNEVVINNGLKEGLVFRAKLMGDVTVNGDLAGLITTDINNDNQSDDGEFGIGNVKVTGKILAKGAIESATSLGSVEIVGGMDFSSKAYALPDALAIISTLGRANQSASIGDIKFGGDVKLAATNVTLVLAGGDTSVPSTSGDIGKIEGTVLNKTGGAATVIDNNVGSIGAIKFSKAIDTTGATVSIEAAKAVSDISGTAVTLTAVSAGSTIGNLSASDGALTLGAITAEKSIGTITTTKGNIALNGLVNAKDGSQGAITSNGGSITISGGITTNGAISAINANGGNLDINGDVTAKSIGNIGVTGDGKHLLVKKVVTANTTTIGDISVGGANADITFSGTGIFDAKTSIGKVTVAGGKITGTADTVEFKANQIGDISVTANKDTTGSLLTNVVFSAYGTDKATNASAKIGSITLDATAAAGVNIAAGGNSENAGEGTGFSSSGNIGAVTITATETGKLLAAADASLVIRAGNSNMGDATATTAADGVNTEGGVSIGDVSISANLSGLSDGTAGTGLVIASGVSIAADGIWVVGTTANGNVTTSAGKVGTGGTIGKVTINNYDAVTGTDVRGFANSTVTSGGTTAFAAGSAIIADKIASIDVATAVDVKHYAPTGQPLKGAVSLGSIDAATGGRDDLFVVIL